MGKTASGLRRSAEVGDSGRSTAHRFWWEPRFLFHIVGVACVVVAQGHTAELSQDTIYNNTHSTKTTTTRHNNAVVFTSQSLGSLRPIHRSMAAAQPHRLTVMLAPPSRKPRSLGLRVYHWRPQELNISVSRVVKGPAAAQTGGVSLKSTRLL